MSMKCHECGAALVERKATPENPYRYTISGLKDVFLCGISLYRCPTCDTESPVIPRIAELHRVISTALVQKASALRGEEVRFLRKNAGFKATDFAGLLGVGPEHLSRFENGKIANLGESADKLARAISMAQIARENEETVKDVLLRRADHLKARNLRGQKRHFKLASGTWKAAA
jgi:putative zinc finger/helix-turn-helix YgiT family protein